MEDRDAAERAGRPFCVVLCEAGVDRVEERSHERRLHGRANDGALLPDVHDCAAVSELFCSAMRPHLHWS